MSENNSSQAYNHHHDEEDLKAIINRISRAIGHFESVKKMVENGRDCSDVLIQLAAVKASVNNIGKEILKEHLSHCIVEAVETGDKAALEALNTAIDKFMK
ncbi:MAG: metal-sensing transcriptional repressor [Bacillota bacterium]|nr:metal-sensing transcriptional repressor [Bacillota bacterium]